MLVRNPYLLLGCFMLILCSCQPTERKLDTEASHKTKRDHSFEPATFSLLDQPLYASEPSQQLLEDYQKHKQAYEYDTSSADLLVWFGRFAAYKGDYREAIALYTKGIQQFPNDPRFYRHRGHRYISLRKFDPAIADLEQAAQLIQDTPNQIEPDGMPNAQNIPVSTLHGNIYYHLGLAYYLQQDFEKALAAYKNCLASSRNHDNLVSSTHWLYMILRRLDRRKEAENYLLPIADELEVIENIDYHRICLFYKGLLSEAQLIKKEESAVASDAIQYALGNWHYYNGHKEKALAIFAKMLDRDSWNSFGFIAAEADIVQAF